MIAEMSQQIGREIMISGVLPKGSDEIQRVSECEVFPSGPPLFLELLTTSRPTCAYMVHPEAPAH